MLVWKSTSVYIYVLLYIIYKTIKWSIRYDTEQQPLMLGW